VNQAAALQEGLDPSPLGFSQVLILKVVKVLCFHTLLQVLILNLVRRGPWEDVGALAAIARAGLKTAATYGEPLAALGMTCHGGRRQKVNEHNEDGPWSDWRIRESRGGGAHF
jgi:hypothetical protein